MLKINNKDIFQIYCTKNQQLCCVALGTVHDVNIVGEYFRNNYYTINHL